MRLIDADALLEQYEDPYTDFIDADDVRNAPTIDAVPVVHGYDTSGGMSLFTCSVCGWHCWDTYCGDTDTYNYCPNCGAKMDGERKDGEE